MTHNELPRLARRDVISAGQLCARAFAATPHVQHFFPDEARRENDAAELFAMRIRYGVRYGEVHVTSTEGEGLAVWIPSAYTTMTTWRQIRSGGMRLYRAVGHDAVARMTHLAAYNDRLQQKNISGPYWFLSILAVDPEHQGRGLATHLLSRMLERLDREQAACYAEITEPGLLSFYRRFGFEHRAESTVPGTPVTVWPIVRYPAARRREISENDTQGSP